MTLRSIEYPNTLQDIIVVGYLNKYARTIMVRPKFQGQFSFIAWPKFFADLKWAIRQDLTIPSEIDPPMRFVVDIREHRARDIHNWEWVLIKQNEKKEFPLSEIMFGPDAIARGEMHFEDALFFNEAKTLMWSCNQPYETINGKAVLHKHMSSILPWYDNVLKEFKPHVIWGAGDSAYADGTEATNFVDQVYNKVGWYHNDENISWLRNEYRRMYRYFWSFDEFQTAMRNYPHIFMWDDHEIRDGWGSESENFSDGNLKMFHVARQVANEYILNIGPRLRKTGDAHVAYISGPQANFIFDCRTSRNYSEPGGRIISEEQLSDFKRFIGAIAKNQNVRFFFLATTVPFVHIKDLVLKLGSRAPKEITDLAEGIRDDLRDSWFSPGNKEALKQVLAAIRDLMKKRGDINVINISGDVHVANAFEIYMPGLQKPLYQITSSAITNREHPKESLALIVGLDQIELDDIGIIRRLWPDISDPNVICITTTSQKTSLNLKVLPVDGSTETDRELVISAY